MHSSNRTALLNMSTYPDLEVYVEHMTIDDIVAWLKQHFAQVSAQHQKGKTTALVVDEMAVMVLAEAAGKSYHSIWFKENRTPWTCDLDIAKTLAHDLNIPVRCSTGGWEEAADAKAETAHDWLEVTPSGAVQPIHWPH